MGKGLIPAVCAQCGATLDVNYLQNSIACPYCNTPFIVDNSSDTYNIQNSGDIIVQGATIVGGPSAENYVKRARQFVVARDYISALDCYNKALDINADCVEAIEGVQTINRPLIESKGEYLFEDSVRTTKVNVILTIAQLKLESIEGKKFSLPASRITKFMSATSKKYKYAMLGNVLRAYYTEIKKNFMGQIIGEYVDIGMQWPVLQAQKFNDALATVKTNY